MPTQVTVSPISGLTEMYVWSENHPMQAAVKRHHDGTWHASLESKDETEYVHVGDFLTLHAALNELSAYEGVPVTEFSGTPYGDVVVG